MLPVRCNRKSSIKLLLRYHGNRVFNINSPKYDNNYAYTPNKISNWSLFKLISSDQALIILKRILPIYVCFNRQMFSGVLINLSFNPQFFG